MGFRRASVVARHPAGIPERLVMSQPPYQQPSAACQTRPATPARLVEDQESATPRRLPGCIPAAAGACARRTRRLSRMTAVGPGPLEEAGARRRRWRARVSAPSTPPAAVSMRPRRSRAPARAVRARATAPLIDGLGGPPRRRVAPPSRAPPLRPEHAAGPWLESPGGRMLVQRRRCAGRDRSRHRPRTTRLVDSPDHGMVGEVSVDDA